MIYSSDRDAEIVSMFMSQGLSIAEIGRRLGVSDVRAGQILHGLHIDTRRVLRERSRQRALARRAKRQADKIERAAKRAETRRAQAEIRYAAWFSAWHDHLSIADIAQTVGLSPHTVMWTIARLRKLYGWFPYRVHRHRRKPQAIAA